MVRITIDRFEEDYAVCEDERGENQRALHRSELPVQAKPGDTLLFVNDQWCIDTKETDARAERINNLFSKIKRRNNP
ncbi:MAG: DUF3006 domain-containing protein [Defluviitaleaceae bacterium]|nr:DUF3006 domain-containing protein [Defluviitaleaceae bacterium]